ncbi:YqiA/YcfP family alpha/beta fold hydrolase [Schauerella aestuarii]|uniref:YqiA/YcfP family alpha/beta fold hydrolase n=1 Tax=Schauerella aestuarii TaxID=2511204 RepID=UPI001371930A|nr:YqiA/YcfP family alpha/beta fold hydrolase [Achromobacter aestuarii]MYZ42727.1 alpha/beta fold hydrolase [Achromobacter aestuarii]
MILYLHGFRSSPQSYKARLMANAMKAAGREDQWACPQLPADPAAAAALALDLATTLLDRAPRATPDAGPRALTVVGSSLGGFYATWLAERLDCKAILLNPAVHAARDLATQVGSHTQFHSDDPFEFKPEYVEALRTLTVAAPTSLDRYFLVAATGDEVLDWTEMRDFYAGARQRIIPGSDHGLSDFQTWMPEVFAFAAPDAVATPQS